MVNQKKYYKYKKKKTSTKWVQKDGNTCDDITFTDGKIEIDFETWFHKYYNN